MPAVTILLAAVVIRTYNEVIWPVIEKEIDRVDAKSKEKAEEVERE